MIKLVSYNIRKGKGADGRSAIEMARIGEELEHLSPTLLLCQEVFHCSRGGPPQSNGLAEALGFDHYFGANKFRAIGDHGNTTLTSMPVTHHENHDISTNPVERRGALYVRATLAGLPLHIFNVHLGLDGFQRSTQLKRIGHILDDAVAHHDPVILAGDFNDWRKQLHAHVHKLDLQSVFTARGRDMPKTWHARRPVFPLDRIYVRHLEVVDAGILSGQPWTHLSDHLPLWAELRPSSQP
ncbi:MAG: endonuclease/exonuclease/phosphatase family protein [Myxococcales bacterium]|nr:endonuclease/exonuclease/phosphatase family protein [Myxococcales bacterium]MDD9967804.1 endonuclease/exonuclease/phosphatase family protein [Myxococcales bacterium]